MLHRETLLILRSSIQRSHRLRIPPTFSLAAAKNLQRAVGIFSPANLLRVRIRKVLILVVWRLRCLNLKTVLGLNHLFIFPVTYSYTFLMLAYVRKSESTSRINHALWVPVKSPKVDAEKESES